MLPFVCRGNSSSLRHVRNTRLVGVCGLKKTNYDAAWIDGQAVSVVSEGGEFVSTENG